MNIETINREDGTVYAAVVTGKETYDRRRALSGKVGRGRWCDWMKGWVVDVSRVPLVVAHMTALGVPITYSEVTLGRHDLPEKGKR